MVNLKIGCAGWAYDDWKGSFYPKSLPPEDRLTHYAKYFNFIEVNTTFYNSPSQAITKTWNDKT
ncbi:MAG: DUF72 domain-containing protein, partial [Candidatus Lokiarchaeota archaeon]|nr:DUF72 domain-containing protein [Candidatus Lokiarchaeota archaeon]